MIGPRPFRCHSVNFLTPLSVTLYLTAAGLLIGRLRNRESAANAYRGSALTAAILAVLIHGWLLKLSLWRPDGLNLGLAQATSLFAWQSALLLCVLSLRRPVDTLGIVVFPLAAAAAALDGLLPLQSTALVDARWTIQLHVVLSVLAYSVLTLAMVQALVLAAQDRQLHRHQSGRWLRVLPPLQSMEQMLFELTAVGFFLLSLALLSGLVFVDNLLAQHLAHKTFFSIAAWLFYAVLLWGHWRFGWRGRSVTRWTLTGYSALLLAYFGSKFVLEQLLGTHWI